MTAAHPGGTVVAAAVRQLVTGAEPRTAAHPLAAVGHVASTSHTRAAGLSAHDRERAARRAIRRYIKRHRSRS